VNPPTPNSGPLRELRRVARDGDVDLDARIFAAEQAVVERDARLRHRLAQLGERAQHVAGTGMRWSLMGLGASALLAVMRPARASAGAHVPTPWWAQLLPIVWPWMPMALRRRVSPAAVALVVDVVLPLFHRRRPPARARR